MADQSSLSPLLPLLTTRLGVDPEAAGFLVTAYALGLKKDLDRGGRVDAMGHGHPCLKVEGLIHAYPRQQAVLDRLQADPGLARCP